MLELERFGEDDGAIADAIRAVHEIGGVELEQAAIEVAAQLPFVLRQVHDLHPQHDDGWVVVHDDVEVESPAGADDPEPGLDLR